MAANYPPPENPGYAVEKPGMITALGIMTLISGILNILGALSLTAAIVLGTLGIGLLCAPVTILPAVLGVFEIIYGLNVLTNPPKPLKPSQTIAILEICCIMIGNFISVVIGIVALVFYSDPAVKGYFARINAQA